MGKLDEGAVHVKVAGSAPVGLFGEHYSRPSNVQSRRTLTLPQIGRPQNKWMVESNNLFGLHRLVDPASHCNSWCSDLLDPTTSVTQASCWIQQHIYSEVDE